MISPLVGVGMSGFQKRRLVFLRFAVSVFSSRMVLILCRYNFDMEEVRLKTYGTFYYGSTD